MKAELVPENGDTPIPITRDVVVVGRRGYCDVVIDHPSLSKRHCVLVKTDGLLVIRDLISTNGTKVKGQRVRWAALLPDDRISLGSYKLRVYLGADHLPGPAELREARLLRSGATARADEAAAPSQARRHEAAAAEPSALAVQVSSSEQELVALPAGEPHDLEPLIPIMLDDDEDEIIDLD
jgi:pSer/pThr/pTyr-binding forkhead associated (FHA) protein